LVFSSYLIDIAPSFQQRKCA